MFNLTRCGATTRRGVFVVARVRVWRVQNCNPALSHSNNKAIKSSRTLSATNYPSL